MKLFFRYFSLFNLFTLFFIKAILCAEVDNFRGRFNYIPDMATIINKKTISFFKEAIKDLNQSSHQCNPKKLYKRMRKDFRNHLTGKFNQWVLKSKDIKIIYTHPSKSIYKYWRSFESFPLKALSPLVFKKPYGILTGYLKVGPVLLGTDKFEHFLGTGFNYFKSYFINKKSIQETVQIGWNDEVGLLGGLSIGVMSFGDLAAEFNGMFFWNDILRFHDSNPKDKKNHDFLAHKKNGPYIICKNNKWHLNQFKTFNWTNYIDDSFDEAINCSLFKNKKMALKIKKSLKEMEKDGNNYNCPISKKRLQELKIKYGKYSPFILNLRGHGTITPKIKKTKWKKMILKD